MAMVVTDLKMDPGSNRSVTALSLVAPSLTSERSAGLNSGSDAAAYISPVPPSMTMALPPLAVMPFSSAVSRSSTYCCSSMSSEMMMSWPSTASFDSFLPPGMGVPSDPVSMRV